MNARTRFACVLVAALAALTPRAALAQVPRTIVYGDTSTNIPRMVTWSGSSWSSASATLDVGESPRWVILQKCPTRNELIAAVGDGANDLNVVVRNGAAWGNLLEMTTNLSVSADRPFYIAYEQVSGDALVMYRVGSTNSTAYYRTWNGTSWSSQGSVTYPGAGDPKFIKLVPKPGSDEIMVAILDNKRDFSAMTWTGSAFTNKVLLDSSTNVSGDEEIDAAYERSSGRGMLTWGDNGTNPPGYRTLSGGIWSARGNMPISPGKGRWYKLTADPASNKIIAMILDGSSNISATVWSGSAWGSLTTLETSAPNTDRRNFDVAFEPAGTRAIAMYGRSSQNSPFYRTFDGASWSAAQTGPSMGNPPSIIQFSPSASGQEIFIGVERKTDGGFCFMRWTGSAIADYQVLASDLGGPGGNECFMISSGPASATRPRIVSWYGVTPE